MPFAQNLGVGLFRRLTQDGEVGGGHQTRQGPDGGAAHQGGGVAEQGLRRGDQGRVVGIADRIEDVPQESVAADPLDRALGEQGAEGGVVQRQQVGQARADSLHRSH